MSSIDKVKMEDPVDTADYDAIARKYEALNKKEHELEKYEDRKQESDHSVQTRKAFQAVLPSTMWRGTLFYKDPCTVVILQHLLWDVQPKTIIEFGACSGGSALYFADLMKIYGFETHVYSMDINLELLGPLAREKRDDITFLQGDCNKVEKTLTPELLKTLPHPWFITEDAHVNTFGVLDYLDRFLIPGDYILCEDLDPVLKFGTPGDEEVTGVKRKIRQLAAFMSKHSERYRVDKRYTDFFGYNGSMNWNGFVKRV